MTSWFIWRIIRSFLDGDASEVHQKLKPLVALAVQVQQGKLTFADLKAKIMAVDALTLDSGMALEGQASHEQEKPLPKPELEQGSNNHSGQDIIEKPVVPEAKPIVTEPPVIQPKPVVIDLSVYQRSPLPAQHLASDADLDVFQVDMTAYAKPQYVVLDVREGKLHPYEVEDFNYFGDAIQFRNHRLDKYGRLVVKIMPSRAGKIELELKNSEQNISKKVVIVVKNDRVQSPKPQWPTKLVTVSADSAVQPAMIQQTSTQIKVRVAANKKSQLMVLDLVEAIADLDDIQVTDLSRLGAEKDLSYSKPTATAKRQAVGTLAAT